MLFLKKKKIKIIFSYLITHEKYENKLNMIKIN